MKEFIDIYYMAGLQTVAVVAAILGVLFAWYRWKQRKDRELRDTAVILYNEVIQAQDTLDKIREIKSKQQTEKMSLDNIYPDLRILDIFSGKYIAWDEYKHYFVKTFKILEFNKIEKFYKYAKLIQENLERIREVLPRQFSAKAQAIQEQIVALASKNEYKSIEEFSEDRKKITDLCEKEPYFFIPSDPIRQLFKFVDLNKNLDQAIVNKLSDLAGVE